MVICKIKGCGEVNNDDDNKNNNNNYGVKIMIIIMPRGESRPLKPRPKIYRRACRIDRYLTVSDLVV